MNELIKYFNTNYGKEYGKIAYPRTTIQIYQAYQSIKDCNISDIHLVSLLKECILPKPKNITEREFYSECLNYEDETLNKMLYYGLVSDVLMLSDGTYLSDENNRLIEL